jgi:hypothetical protein
MKYFDVVQGFIERVETGASSVETLGASFRRAVEELGFRHFACCSHVDPLHPPREAIMLHNYPAGWVRHYSEARVYRIDPVWRHADRSPLPFFWDTAFRGEAVTPAQKRILTEATGYGISHGYTVPLYLSWIPGSLRASCSFVPDSRCIDSHSIHAARVLATYLYAALAPVRIASHAPIVTLTARERECWTCPVSVDSLSSSLFVSGLISSILHRRAV